METEKYVSFTTGSAGDPSKTIHGVNLGGWLVLERYITPYLFALTECDVSENPKYHVYPGQINLPAFLSDGKGENIGPECPPVAGDYPMDQWTMVEAFPNRELARKYLDRHWDTFVTEEDIVRIKNAGITHVRIPVGHWITGNIEENERYVTGEWPYLVRAIEWCRKHSIGVWIDLHTAPGSQNGFDNSGRANQNGPTGTGWSGSSSNVARTLEILDEISAQASEDGLSDVVGSFCILNEPFIDTDKDVYRTFVIDASEIVRRHLPDVTVVIGDTFDAGEFDAATWAIAKNAIRPALLDSHYYHVFFELARSFSPRQHIAYVCEHNRKDTQACCYDDVEGEEKVPSLINGGMGRVIGEWSASYDTLVFVKLDEVMDGIRKDGVAPELDRVIPVDRQKFLQNFVEAQMVVWEDVPSEGNGVSKGWFYWNFKMEGGAFAEWDFLRGIDEGWIPKPESNRNAINRFGSCLDILARTPDDLSIVHEFPPPVKEAAGANWQAVVADDDLVLNHGASVTTNSDKETPNLEVIHSITFIILSVLVAAISCRKCLSFKRKKGGYETTPDLKI